MPALAAAKLSGCLSSVWCGQSFTRCRMIFRFLEVAVTGVILLDDESLEVCSEVSVAQEEELCELMIQLDLIHPGSVSHIREIFVQ